MTGDTDRAVLARELRETITAVPGVTRLVGGSPVEVATHFAGGRVAGLRLAGDIVEAYVAVDRVPVAPVADRVRGAVAARLARDGDRRPVRVVVADLDLAALPAAKGR